MGFSYLGDNKNWKDVTRDERYFCAELFFEIRKDVKKFIEWLNKNEFVSFTDEELNSEWEIGFEVCFYRDYIHNFRKAEKQQLLKSKTFPDNSYSPKRTFDLCLFSEKKIIIIEAKAQARFHSEQNKEFLDDIASVKGLVGDHIDVIVVALAAQTYFNNLKRQKIELPAVFGSRKFSWHSLTDATLVGGALYHNEAFEKAEASYNN